MNYTNPNHTEPIRMDGQDSPSACSDKQTEGNTAAEYALYEQIIRDNVCYEQLCEEYPYRVAEIDEIIRLITDTVCIRRETVRINKTDYPHEIVRGIFLKLGYEHVEFVMAWLKENPVNIANIKNYILTMLYNTYNTLYNRLSADVNYDLHGGWMDRGGRDNKARDGNY